MKTPEVGDEVWCADAHREALYQGKIEQIVCQGNWAVVMANGKRWMVALSYVFPLTERVQAVDCFTQVLESAIMGAELELEGFRQDVTKAEAYVNVLKKKHADAVNELCKAGADSGFVPREDELEGASDDKES